MKTVVDRAEVEDMPLGTTALDLVQGITECPKRNNGLPWPEPDLFGGIPNSRPNLEKPMSLFFAKVDFMFNLLFILLSWHTVLYEFKHEFKQQQQAFGS